MEAEHRPRQQRLAVARGGRHRTEDHALSQDDLGVALETPVGQGRHPVELVRLDPAGHVLLAVSGDQHRRQGLRVERVQVLALTVGKVAQEDLDDPVARGLLLQGLHQQVGSVVHLDAEQLEDPPERRMLLASPVPVEDVVEEELLHHRRDHAVDLGPRFVDQRSAQAADLGGDADHLDGTGGPPLTSRCPRPVGRREREACAARPRTAPAPARGIPGRRRCSNRPTPTRPG